jgi:hypothetical protein
MYPYTKSSLISLDGKIQNAGAKTMLFMTWARDGVSSAQRFEMDMAVNHYYERHAAAVGASVAPVGRAWERAKRKLAVSLHAADGSHPNERGTYLAACVFYTELTQSPPTGLGSGGLALTAQEQTELQQVAWETHIARQHAASPLIGRWPLAQGVVGRDLLPTDELTLGDEASGTAFGPGKYAAIPYYPGLNPPKVTVSLRAYRADWSLSTTSYETLVSKSWGYRLNQFQLTLEARLHTVDTPQAQLTYSVAALSPGWHHFALTYDGATFGLWIDANQVASTAASGDIRYYAISPDEERYDGIAVGVHTVDTATTGENPSATFTGALGDLRLFDQALGQTELQKLF